MPYKEKDKKAYLKYFDREKKAGRTAQTFGRWMKAKSGMGSYGSRTQAVSSRLKDAGVDDEQLRRMRD